MATRTAVILSMVSIGIFWAWAGADAVLGYGGAAAALSLGCFVIAAVYGYLTAPRRPQ